MSKRLRRAVASAAMPTPLSILDGLPVVVIRWEDVGLAGCVDSVSTIGPTRAMSTNVWGKFVRLWSRRA
eukprot:5195731-Pyramimonas_sp.AAC.1